VSLSVGRPPAPHRQGNVDNRAMGSEGKLVRGWENAVSRDAPFTAVDENRGKIPRYFTLRCHQSVVRYTLSVDRNKRRRMSYEFNGIKKKERVLVSK